MERGEWRMINVSVTKLDKQVNMYTNNKHFEIFM